MNKSITGKFFASFFAVLFVISSPAVAAKKRATEALEQLPNEKLVRAIDNKRAVHFVEGRDMKVITVLPDDTHGAQHQKFLVELKDGYTLLLVYNLDMCERVPVQVGDRVGAGGMFIWTDRGGLLHWLHHDPRKNRPDGYVELNGKQYCK